MEASIIKIGNSQGLIIPKSLLSKLGFNKRVNLEIGDGGLHVFPVKNKETRHNWDKQFAFAIKTGHKPENVEYIENEFDKNEWTW
jgi:antitoxin MazE